jgi:hypothetical protein
MRKTAAALVLIALTGCATDTGASRVGQYVNPCNPHNVPPAERASMLHQDLPGGSDCTRSSAQRAYDGPPTTYTPPPAPNPYYPR